MSRDRARVSRSAALALALLVGAAGARADELRVGFGTKPLPARMGESMGGYGGLTTRRATGVLDPPQARALVFEQGPLRVGLVVLDLVIARPNVRDLVIEATRGLGLDLVAVVATHSHSGPGGYMPGWLSARVTAGEYDPEMPARLARAAALALERAVGDLAPARVTAASRPVGLTRNRRFADGAVDRELAVLRADFADGRAPVVLFELGAHATLLSADNTELSADWPGAARAALESSGARAVFVPGPLGDQEPAVDLESFAPVERQREVMREFGQRVALAVARVSPSGEPRAATEPLEALERWVETPAPQLRSFCSLWWIGAFVRGPLREFVAPRAPFQVVRAGNAELVLVPAEPIAAVGAALREVNPSGRKRFVVAHANDWLGYVVDPPTYERGGYESCLCLLGPRASDWLVNAAGEALQQLDAKVAPGGGQ